MSHALYFTRLFWDWRSGIAKLHGRTVKLTAAPPFPGALVDLIDYAPELHTFQIRERACDRMRDLEPPEQEMVRRWLAAFSAAVKRGVRT